MENKKEKKEPAKTGVSEKEIAFANEKEKVLLADFARLFILHTLYFSNLEAIRTSETLAEWAKGTWVNKRYDYFNLKPIAAKMQKKLTSIEDTNKEFLRELKKIDGTGGKSWEYLKDYMKSDTVQDMFLIIEMLCRFEDLTPIIQALKEGIDGRTEGAETREKQ